MTEKQSKLLTFIRNKVAHGGMGPTHKEMKEFMDVSSNGTLEDMLKALTSKGYIVTNKKQFRGIRLTSKGIGYDNNLLVKETQASLPESGYSVPSNASTSTTITTYSDGIMIKTNGISPYRKGGEKSGTT